MTVIRIFTLPVRIIIKAGTATTEIVVGSGMPGCIVLLMFLGGISMIIKQQRFIRQVYPKPSQKAIARLQDGLDIVNTGEFAFTLRTTAEWQDTGVTFAPRDWIFVEYASRENDQDSDRDILLGRIGNDPARQYRVGNGLAKLARVSGNLMLTHNGEIDEPLTVHITRQSVRGVGWEAWTRKTVFTVQPGQGWQSTGQDVEPLEKVLIEYVSGSPKPNRDSAYLMASASVSGVRPEDLDTSFDTYRFGNNVEFINGSFPSILKMKVADDAPTSTSYTVRVTTYRPVCTESCGLVNLPSLESIKARLDQLRAIFLQ